MAPAGTSCRHTGFKIQLIFSCAYGKHADIHVVCLLGALVGVLDIVSHAGRPALLVLFVGGEPT